MDFVLGDGFRTREITLAGMFFLVDVFAHRTSNQKHTTIYFI